MLDMQYEVDMEFGDIPFVNRFYLKPHPGRRELSQRRARCGFARLVLAYRNTAVKLAAAIVHGGKALGCVMHDSRDRRNG